MDGIFELASIANVLKNRPKEMKGSMSQKHVAADLTHAWPRPGGFSCSPVDNRVVFVLFLFAKDPLHILYVVVEGDLGEMVASISPIPRCRVQASIGAFIKGPAFDKTHLQNNCQDYLSFDCVMVNRLESIT